QIERFWGPVEYPARFTRHDMYVGGESHYVMTGPGGDQSRGWWEFLEVVEGERFTVLDGFANPDGTKSDFAPPMRMDFVFSSTPGGSRMTTTTLFASIETLNQMLEMGMEAGMQSAMSQIDAIVADLASFAAGVAADADIISDTQVRVARVIRGTVDQVWRAHHEPDLVARWLTGPDGWIMSRCDLATEVGGEYRYEWAPAPGTEGETFGFGGELVASEPPHRAVTTERMLGIDGPTTLNEMTLTAVDGGTLCSILITYPDAETRDMILGTGMVFGMEASYARLEREVLATA
ncbi:MAG TPA: SRPBCC family protein, partial [Ilumatobacteraceae bacterium]|nr:SRPBCC family protein [Ilumatobacteraceae bacterium]